MPGWDEDAVWQARLVLHFSDSLPSDSLSIQSSKLHLQFLTDIASSESIRSTWKSYLSDINPGGFHSCFNHCSFAASCRDRHAHDASAAGHVCAAHDEATLWSCSWTWHTGQFLKCPQNCDIDSWLSCSWFKGVFLPIVLLIPVAIAMKGARKAG
jgi:hypothetical protein